MTNETEKKTKEQPKTEKIRKVSTGAWWKNFKKKKAEKTDQGNDQIKAVEVKPTKAKPVKATPVEAKSVEPKPTKARTVKAKPTEAKSAESKPVTPRKPRPAKSKKIDQAEKKENAEQVEQTGKTTQATPSPRGKRPTKQAPAKAAQPAKAKPPIKKTQETAAEKTAPAQQTKPQAKAPEQAESTEIQEEKKKPSRRPRRRGKKPSPAQQETAEAVEKEEAKQESEVQKDGQKDDSREGTQKSRPSRPRNNNRKKQSTSSAPTTKSDYSEEDDIVEDTEEESGQEPKKKQKIRLLINAEEPEECRIAQVEDGRLESFHVNTVVRERTKNNIYKGRIVSIEANLQAAFVEIGTGRNGFLPFTDIHPEYYRQDLSEQSRKLIDQQQWKKLKIEDVIKRGQEVLVQVVKEVTGNKGANMTTFLSLPGRCLVLMPGSDSAGISRKISGEQRRSRLREIMSDFNIPEGIGYIVRTASAEITKTALQQDLHYLTGLWTEIKKRGQTSQTPALVYEDQDTVHRFLRDHFTQDIQEIIVDTEDSYNQVAKFVDMLPARQKKVLVRLHRGSKPIFNQSNIEEQIESIYQPQVQLPSGGSIVIDPTEALVAIDVNSGRTSQKGDFEKSIFLANMEAGEELARQLRLRDLGGLIVVDFIDMRSKGNIREVERQVKNAMKRDKAKVDISRISRFGLMQISRQKMGAPIEKGSYRRCEHCEGRGVVRSVETLALYYLRRIQTGVTRKKIKRVEANLPLEVGQYLLNKKRAELMELENKHQVSIIILPNPEMKPSENNIRFLS
ncbi:MAG: Rne/Rng family ribonuclease [Candidatus Electrothrix communis]|nr:MAG: Rne/Rng family ribonuclease [Candidatus Electrothrix communis]